MDKKSATKIVRHCPSRMKKVKNCTKLVPFFARCGRLRPKWTLFTLFGHYFKNTHSRHYVPLTSHKAAMCLTLAGMVYTYSGVYQTDRFVLRRVIPADFRGVFYISPIIIASGGTDILQQTFTNRSLPSLSYPELRTTLPFLSQQVSVYVPEGYSPVYIVLDSFSHYTCHADPLFECDFIGK